MFWRNLFTAFRQSQKMTLDLQVQLVSYLPLGALPDRREQAVVCNQAQECRLSTRRLLWTTGSRRRGCILSFQDLWVASDDSSVQKRHISGENKSAQVMWHYPTDAFPSMHDHLNSEGSLNKKGGKTCSHETVKTTFLSLISDSDLNVVWWKAVSRKM